MQGLLLDERGSTRLALTIAAIVLALLAAVAVPMLLNQGRAAQDVRAQSTVKRLVDNVETCRVGADSYGECDEEREVVTDRSVRWGRGPGDAGLVPRRSGERSFTAYAVSRNGSRLYVLTRDDRDVSRSVCDHVSIERLERDGCHDSGW